MAEEIHTLINGKEALKILTWVSQSGLYSGSKGTGDLTRFPHGCYSKEECLALKQKLITQGIARREKLQFDKRKVSYELV